MLTTDTQRITLGNHIRANAAVADALAAGNLGDIRDWYNGQASPNFWVFKASVDTDSAFKSIDKAEYVNVPASEGTTVAQLIESIEAASLARRQEVALELMLHNGTYDPSIESNRDALVKIFPATMPNTRAALLVDATRLATEAEKLFAIAASGPAGGDGSAQNNSAIAVITGQLTTADVDLALELTA